MFKWLPFRRVSTPPPPAPSRSQIHLPELPVQFVDTSQRIFGHGSAVYNDFLSFVGRKNVLEVAVALIVGTAFTNVSRSLVSDIFTPLLSLMPFFEGNLVNKFLILRCGSASQQHPGRIQREAQDMIGSCQYNTLEQAHQDGAITLAYGRFVESSLQFLFSALILYLLVKVVQLFIGKQIVHATQKCRYCMHEISIASQRCAFCSTWLDGREDKEATHAKDWGFSDFTEHLFHSGHTEAQEPPKKYKTARFHLN